MCRRVYKYYTACGCVLSALFYHKCAQGSASPLCKEEDGIVTRDGEKCPYHARVARRQARSRSRTNGGGGGGPQDSEKKTRTSIENPLTFTGAGKEVAPARLEDRHKLGDFQVFIKDIDTFLKKLAEHENGTHPKTQTETQTESQSQLAQRSKKQEGKNSQQLKDRKVSRELSPLAGCSDWTDDDENDNAIARRKRRSRLKKEFRALVRENEKNKQLFDASDVFMSSDGGDDDDVSDSSSESGPGDAYPSPMSMSPHPGNYGDVSEGDESSDAGHVHPSSSSLSTDHGHVSDVSESSNDSTHGNMQSSIPGPVHRSEPLSAFLSWDMPPENSENMEEDGETELEEAEDEPDYDSHDSDMPDADKDDGDYVSEPTWPPTGVEWTSKLKYMTGIPRRNYQ
ncbi:uncharacterized protein CLUP02_13774 [Colletotrichum lupini]|uniref:Uncharacterized protein n=1 Tax=Colletotrichum lupini TaxID=145971 RepID=A0A9Q8WM26_9PEZI|nr:uncharacterized protein CLUP02_13774 [Colletotrichum lupini]KAK1704245.1 hypothetical protein BDP67DRAFT_584020 [Colletotrichum lupini]UQC88251.1 hypothetical protein CLUP02_13774 [Colletotrichum lupini]